MLARQHGERRAEHQQVQVVGEEQRVQRLDDVGLRAVGAHGEAILLATQPVGVAVHATHAISEPAARAPCATENRVRFRVLWRLRPVAVGAKGEGKPADVVFYFYDQYDGRYLRGWPGQGG